MHSVRLGQRTPTGNGFRVLSGLQNDDRDVAIGPRLIPVVLGPDLCHRGPETLFFFRCCDSCRSVEFVGADLNVHFRIGDEVQVPERVVLVAALGSNDEVVVAIGAVDERVPTLVAGFAPGCREHESAHPVPLVAPLAVGLDVLPGVLGDPWGRAVLDLGHLRHLSLGVPAIYVLSILPHLDSGHVFDALAYRVSMLRRVVLGFAALAVGGVVLIGIEIVIALRREYLPTEPALKLDDTFGNPGDDAVTLVVMGDSTAAGLGAGEPANAYPQLLAQRLASDGFRVDLRVFGLSGARVKDVLDEQLPKALEADPDYVFIGIGANDVTHLTSLGEVRSDMAEVLRTLQDRTEAETVLAGAPDMRAPAFYEPLRSLAGISVRTTSLVRVAIVFSRNFAIRSS